MKTQLLNFEIDHAKTHGRKDGVLYIQKGFHRKRDLLLTFLDAINNTVVLISAGRSLLKVENMQHPNLRSVIRIKGNEPIGLMNWCDNMEVFRYVSPSVEKAIFLAEDLAQRGDIVLFSPYGTKDEVSDWFALYDKKIKNIGF